MKIVIFAGGVGTRLWPLSRQNTPKQFEKIVGDKSTIQLTVDRVFPIVNPEDIYISSGEKYKNILYKQLPQIPKKNIILEPAMRDVGAAVGLVTAVLAKESPGEPFIILWSDHIVKNEETFRNILNTIPPWETKIYSKLLGLKTTSPKVIMAFLDKHYGEYKSKVIEHLFMDISWKHKYEKVGWMEKLLPYTTKNQV